MKNYKGTGIDKYEIFDDQIRIKWRDSDRWNTISYRTHGEEHVENMKELAKKGRGLNEYFNRNIRDY